MMSFLYSDIETIPAQDERIFENIKATIKPPGSIKKAESIQKWMDENADSAAEEKWLKTSLDGSRGEIISIAWAFDDDIVRVNFRDSEESETSLLVGFYENVIQAILDNNIQHITNVIHGSKDLFDLRFLYQRSVILGVKPTFKLHQDSRYNGDHTFDTMTAWAGWGNYCSLDSVCSALGIKSPKGEMTGADVWPEFQKGNIAGIVRYNMADVVALREVHKRLTFA
jgi:hypothetical protein